MMGIREESLKAAKRRKRAEKKHRRELAHSNQQPQSASNDMEEIHLKRRVLDPSSELLLTWWDETKNQQEGLLISCKCNNNCTSTSSAASPVLSSASNNNNENEGSLLVREKLNIRSPPYVSNMMDTSYSGVALYNEANGLSASSLTTGTTSTIRPLPRILPKADVVDMPMVVARHNDSNWRNKRPYPCDYCAKPFRTSYEKRRHEMIHTGNRPWQCTECNKSFVDRACLRNHMKKRHVGDKPFKCSFCDITFFNTMNRAKHERTHEERLKVARAELAMKREMVASGVKLEDPSSAIDQVGDQLRQQLIDTSEELEVGNGVEGEDPMLEERSAAEHGSPSANDGDEGMITETNHHASDQRQAVLDMADVFNITVIPDTVTIAETDPSRP